MKNITDIGVFLFIPKKKKNADRAEGNAKCNCCSVAFKSLNIAPLGRKEDSFLGSRQPCTKLYKLILKQP